MAIVERSSRLDQAVYNLGMVRSRSQAESYIKLGKVMVDNKVITKPGFFVHAGKDVAIKIEEQFVSRAGLKLKSVAHQLKLDFAGKTILDVGSSTGGFTDFALSRGAAKSICVDVGTDQLHPDLRRDPRIELHEKTDIRKFKTDQLIDIILIDVSFISLTEILPYIAQNLANDSTLVVAMLKPQFESGGKVKNSGVIKNDSERRKIIRQFELWARQYFIVINKSDSDVAGARGNRERFYLMRRLHG